MDPYIIDDAVIWHHISRWNGPWCESGLDMIVLCSFLTLVCRSFEIDGTFRHKF